MKCGGLLPSLLPLHGIQGSCIPVLGTASTDGSGGPYGKGSSGFVETISMHGQWESVRPDWEVHLPLVSVVGVHSVYSASALLVLG